MKLVRRAMPGTAARAFSSVFRKISAPAAALHPLQHGGRSVLQRHVEILADVVVLGNRLQQPVVMRLG
jgi:hypothetical protein